VCNYDPWDGSTNKVLGAGSIRLHKSNVQGHLILEEVMYEALVVVCYALCAGQKKAADIT